MKRSDLYLDLDLATHPCQARGMNIRHLIAYAIIVALLMIFVVVAWRYKSGGMEELQFRPFKRLRRRMRRDRRR